MSIFPMCFFILIGIYCSPHRHQFGLEGGWVGQALLAGERADSSRSFPRVRAGDARQQGLSFSCTPSLRVAHQFRAGYKRNPELLFDPGFPGAPSVLFCLKETRDMSKSLPSSVVPWQEVHGNCAFLTVSF